MRAAAAGAREGVTSVTPRPRAAGLAQRCVASAAYGGLNRILYPAATLLTAEAAGGQFGNSDAGYMGSIIGMSLFGHIGIPAIVLLGVLAAIRWHPVRSRWFAAVTLLALTLPQPASAYYDKTDFTEPYTILPNESAFWIPDAGANKVSLKSFIVPHTKPSGSGGFFDFYVPSGRLIIVDRTPFSREWVDAADRGTSKLKEGFPCQSKEGLNVTVGVAIGASVTEADAAK